MSKFPWPRLPDISFLLNLFKKKSDKANVEVEPKSESKINDALNGEVIKSDVIVVRPGVKTSFIAKIFGRTLYELRFWKMLFFVALIGLIVQPIGMTYMSTKNRERILILDPSKDFILSPAKDLKNTTAIQDYIAELATTALLARNPNGLDKKILLDQVFTKSAGKRVDAMVQKDKEWFRERLVHQKAEIKTVHTLQTSDTKAYTQVKGQIFRGGFFRGQTFQQGMDFTLNLILVKNPSFGNNLTLPMAVKKFKLILEPLKRGVGTDA
ncbi:MAG TPA: hypothetical protein QF753_08125 [Victivallales bacterium]|nr:hypothetical protein [Victivallales bacterium]